MCAVHSRHSLGCDTKEAFRTPPTFWSRIAAARLDAPFFLQAIERGINAPYCPLPFNAEFDLLPHRDSIGSIFQSKKRQDNDVLKFAEIIATRHYLYNIKEMFGSQTIPISPRGPIGLESLSAAVRPGGFHVTDRATVGDGTGADRARAAPAVALGHALRGKQRTSRERLTLTSIDPQR